MTNPPKTPKRGIAKALKLLYALDDRLFALTTQYVDSNDIADVLADLREATDEVMSIGSAAQPPEGMTLVKTFANTDEIVTRLYQRFKEWSKQGFGPEDVTWCEVKADINAMLSAAPKLSSEKNSLLSDPKKPPESVKP